MKVVKGDIWDYVDEGWIVIPTNGSIGKYGAIMGAGLALETKQRFPKLPKLLEERLITWGNGVYVFDEYKLITLPTKHSYKDRKSDIMFMAENIYTLKTLSLHLWPQDFYLPKLGCGKGGLKWKDVEEAMDLWLDERFTVVDRV